MGENCFFNLASSLRKARLALGFSQKLGEVRRRGESPVDARRREGVSAEILLPEVVAGKWQSSLLVSIRDHEVSRAADERVVEKLNKL